MNLSLDIRRLLPIVAVGVVALAAAVLVTRGVGGGSTAASAQQVLDRALKEEPKSGGINMRLNVSVELPGNQLTSELVMTGAGTDAVGGKPAQGRSHWSERDFGKAPAVHDELAVANRGYIGVGGRWYRVTPAQYKRLFDSGTSKSLFQSPGFDPLHWIKNPKLESTTSHVGGVAANEISGDVDAQQILDELGVYKGASSPRAQQVVDALRAAPKHGTVNLFVGKQDGIIRKLSVITQADASKGVPPLRLTLSFALGLDKVNQPVAVTEPKGALPPARIAGIPREKLGNRADKVFGPAAKPAARPVSKPAPKPAAKPAAKPAPKPAPKPGRARTRPQPRPAPATARRSRQAYVSCVQGAQDLAALDRCQALLP